MAKRSIAKNSLFNVIYKGFTALFPLVTTTYISRVLLPDGVGKVSYANTIVNYFIFLAALGIPNYGVKIIAKTGESIEQRSRGFLELLTINAFSTAVCCVAYFAFVNLNGYFADKRSLMNVMGIMLILNFINVDWFYQGIEEYSYIATRSIALKIFSFVGMLLFVKAQEDYLKYAFILCVATAGNYVLNIVHVRKYICLRKCKLSIRNHIRPIMVLLAASIATEIYTMLDTVMIEYYQTDANVGYYSNAVKIVRMVYTVTIAMVATFYPRISSYYAEGKMEELNSMMTVGTKILAMLSVPLVVGLIGLSDMIVTVLMGDAFIAMTPTLRILAILVAVFSFAYFLGHIVLMASGNESSILKATIAGALVNAFLNFVLISKYAHNGAAIASVCSEIVVTAILLKKSATLIRINWSGRFRVSVVVAAACMGLGIILMRRFFTSGILALFLITAVSAVVYFALLFMMKNDLVLSCYRKIVRSR